MDELRIGSNRREVLEFLSQKVVAVWEGFDQARESEPEITPEIKKLLSEELPRFGSEATDSISQSIDILDKSLAQSRPRFLAYIGSSGLEVGAIADFLASSYDINQAVDNRASTLLEEQCIKWVAQFIGYPYPVGFFTSGGMVSNLTALAAARRSALPNSRKMGLQTQTAIYSSKESHYSIMRAAEILGFGSDALRLIDVDDHHRMRSSELEIAIERDLARGITPVAIIATAGTTLTGAIDPIEEIANIAKRFGIWLHIDGAYGIPAVGTKMAPLFTGMHYADSITIDAHKWLFVPKSCSLLLVRDLTLLSDTFSHEEAYMPHDEKKPNPVDFTLEYSRPLRALKLWLAFKTHGADAFRNAIEFNIELA
ncbi:MAG: L-2,4-diaminobutyrate decarboxylase, partial [Actinobacteria bacterium]|nr:L-2,4-diaminobutyrate decarboxylase [Actinomycetota bacterium]